MINKLIIWAKDRRIFGRFATRDFFNYFWISVLISLSNIIMLWILIDLLNISTIVSSVLVVGGTFVGRYILFKCFGVI